MKLLINRSDGGVSVAPYTEGMDVERFIANWEACANPNLPGEPEKNLGTCVGYEIVPDDAVPADRTFRNAWKAEGSKVRCDMPKAKEIHRGRIRAQRKARLEKLDGEWMKCIGLGDAAGAAAVEAKRQLLRDAPAYPPIEAAMTPEELKVAIPPIIKDGAA